MGPILRAQVYDRRRAVLSKFSVETRELCGPVQAQGGVSFQRSFGNRGHEGEVDSKAHLGTSRPSPLLRKAIPYFPLEALAFYCDPLEEISLTLRP